MAYVHDKWGNGFVENDLGIHPLKCSQKHCVASFADHQLIKICPLEQDLTPTCPYYHAKSF